MLHPTYTLFRVPGEEMVVMGCQDEMVEMEPQEAKGRGETLVCRGHLVCKDHLVCRGHLAFRYVYTSIYIYPFVSSDRATIKQYS